jgi:hypothetical protein
MKKLFGMILLSFVIVTGSAWAANLNPSANKPEDKASGKSSDKMPRHSGFLKDYSKLQAATDREGVWNYIDKSKDYSGYTKIMFDPVEVYITPNPEYKGVQPDALKRMTDNYLDAFKAAVKPAYEIVNAPGPDVLHVRTAITGVELVSPGANVTDFLPIKAVFNAGRAAAGNAPKVVEMTSEVEVLDANGNRLGAAVATRKGDTDLKQDSQVKWADLQAITEYWAKGFRQRLDQMKSASRKP